MEKQEDHSESTNEHEKFLRLAIELAEENVRKQLGGPFGAVIVKDGKFIASGANKVVPNSDPTAHAEVMAIRNACEKLQTHVLEGCAIYTSCEPCPMCLAATYWAHLDHIYYANSKEDAKEIGFDDHFIYEEFARSPDQRRVGFTQLLRDQSKAFTMWRDLEDKVHY